MQICAALIMTDLQTIENKISNHILFKSFLSTAARTKSYHREPVSNETGKYANWQDYEEDTCKGQTKRIQLFPFLCNFTTVTKVQEKISIEVDNYFISYWTLERTLKLGDCEVDDLQTFCLMRDI